MKMDVGEAVDPIPEGRPILLAEDNEDDVIITTERALRIGKVKDPVYIVRDGEEAPDYLQKTGKYADAATRGREDRRATRREVTTECFLARSPAACLLT